MRYSYWMESPYLDVGGTRYLVEQIGEIIKQIEAGDYDFSDYVTKTELQEELAKIHIDADFSNYVTKQELIDALRNVSVDLSNYYTKSEVDQRIAAAASGGTIDLSSYATKTYVDQAVANVSVDTSAFYNKTEVDNKLSNKADKSELFSGSYNDLTDKPNLSNYATKSELSDYATKEYVDEKSQDVDLDDYYTKDEVDNLIPKTKKLIETYGDDTGATLGSGTIYENETGNVVKKAPQLPLYKGGTKLNYRVHIDWDTISDSGKQQCCISQASKWITRHAYPAGVCRGAVKYGEETIYYDNESGEMKAVIPEYELDANEMVIGEKSINEKQIGSSSTGYTYAYYFNEAGNVPVRYYHYKLTNIYGSLKFIYKSTYKYGVGMVVDKENSYVLKTQRKNTDGTYTYTFDVDADKVMDVYIVVHSIIEDQVNNGNDITITVKDSENTEIEFTEVYNDPDIAGFLEDYILYGTDNLPTRFEDIIDVTNPDDSQWTVQETHDGETVKVPKFTGALPSYSYYITFWTANSDISAQSDVYKFVPDESFTSSKYIRYLGEEVRYTSVEVPVDMSEYYTKPEIDAMSIGGDSSNYYTKSEVDELLPKSKRIVVTRRTEGDGVNINVEYRDGTTTTTPVYDGAKGDKGDKGDPFTYSDFTSEQLAALKGSDGYTPVKGIDYFDGAKGDKGDPFTYSDFTSEQLAALKGSDGYTPVKGVDYFDGAKGDPGTNGTTPVRGTDYWTTADQQAIVNDVLAALPAAESVSA